MQKTFEVAVVASMFGVAICLTTHTNPWYFISLFGLLNFCAVAADKE